MGSVQALRSEALSYRSMSDTALEMSNFLAKTNKSLGSQITSMLEQLQGVIDARTQAANGLVGKLNSGINGKGGIGERGVSFVFSTVNVVMSISAAIAANTTSTDGQTKAASWVKVLQLVGDGAELAKILLDAQGIKESLTSSYYDYEKLVSTVGLSSKDMADGTRKDASTVNLLKIRDGLMPRYKPLDDTYSGGDGYIGTRKRI